MKLTLYQIDAFTDKLFGGNPAAVIPLQEWIDDELMQKIALENNLSETVFFVPSQKNSDDSDFEIRWFTPAVEINLCGHATLASAFVIFNYLHFDKPGIKFSSKSGILKVTKNDSLIEMDFPSWMPEKIINGPADFEKELGGTDIISMYKNRDLLLELKDEDAVKNCSPDFSLIKKSGYKIIITAPGDEVDFVSRFFAPSAGIDEDPVTGSAHSQLIPFWSNKLNKKNMTALQLSQRRGTIFCEQKGNRVSMSGNCIFYMKGEIEVEG
ncbi:MAG: PhzF family phenazine biosynthesis protein [Ginsengibacter sp.]